MEEGGVFQFNPKYPEKYDSASPIFLHLKNVENRAIKMEMARKLVILAKKLTDFTSNSLYVRLFVLKYNNFECWKIILAKYEENQQ